MLRDCKLTNPHFNNYISQHHKQSKPTELFLTSSFMVHLYMNYISHPLKLIIASKSWPLTCDPDFTEVHVWQSCKVQCSWSTPHCWGLYIMHTLQAAPSHVLVIYTTYSYCPVFSLVSNYRALISGAITSRQISHRDSSHYLSLLMSYGWYMLTGSFIHSITLILLSTQCWIGPLDALVPFVSSPSYFIVSHH